MPAGDRRGGRQSPKKASQSDACTPSARSQLGCGCKKRPSLKHGENPQPYGTLVA